ncbi:MAG: lytic transglycosylase domain-containing protein [Burkholderiales bacterium]|nr:lytic transglycosylase domain-containing protein [Burkholderiales bacterium]
MRSTYCAAASPQCAQKQEREKRVRKQWRRRLSLRWGVALACAAALPAYACWDDAAMRYQVSSALLYAIARTESGLDPNAVGRNANGSRDIGLMQINSAWLPTLASHGIGERELFEPCTNIYVGAWILAGKVSRHGYTWEAVGAYNAASPALRRSYIEKVRRRLAANAPATGPVAQTATSASARQTGLP